MIRLASEDKTTREIAKGVHISLGITGQILNKVTGGYAVEDEGPKT
ncbi:MAG: hypothetical protein WKF36_09895 [Candidatus Nitrosocosmicus sp.]